MDHSIFTLFPMFELVRNVLFCLLQCHSGVLNHVVVLAEFLNNGHCLLRKIDLYCVLKHYHHFLGSM